MIGDGSTKRAALIVYKQPGDPFASPDGADSLMQRLGDVPYSPLGIPGHVPVRAGRAALKHRMAGVAAVPVPMFTAEQLTAMDKETLFAHAKSYDIDLGKVTTLRDALPIVAAHHKVALPA